MNDTVLLIATAPATVTGIHDGQILGPLTLSGAAAATAVILVTGLRGSDRLKWLHHRDGSATWGIVTGSVWMAAGTSWASTAAGIASVPTSILGGGSGNLGAGGTALVLTLTAYIPKWRRTVPPAVLGISAAVTYAAAGGIWGVIVNSIRMIVAHLTGGAA